MHTYAKLSLHIYIYMHMYMFGYGYGYVYVYVCVYWQPRTVSGAQRRQGAFDLSLMAVRWPQTLKYQVLTPVSRAGRMGRGSVLWGSVYFIQKKMLSRRLSLKCHWPQLCLGSIFSSKKGWESEYLVQGSGIHMTGWDRPSHTWGLQRAQYLKAVHPLSEKNSEFNVGGTEWLLGSYQTVEYHLPHHVQKHSPKNKTKTHSQRLALKFILLITSDLLVKNVLTVVMKRHREKSSPLEEIAVGGREWLLIWSVNRKGISSDSV